MTPLESTVVVVVVYFGAVVVHIVVVVVFNIVVVIVNVVVVALLVVTDPIILMSNPTAVLRLRFGCVDVWVVTIIICISIEPMFALN